MKLFNNFKSQYSVNMEKMFAAVSELYARYWHEFFHFAIFENPNQSWDEAFHNTHEKYFSALQIDKANNVLEIACGRGALTNLIASRARGSVLGIDISRSQLARAKRYERQNLRFKHHDVMKVDELNEMFDSIICLDAACYFPDRKLAIKKIASVLRPKGRFLLIDWCRQEGLSYMQENLVLKPFMKAWGINSLETKRGYESHFEKAGLKIKESIDLNHLTEKNWNFGYENAIRAIRETSSKELYKLIWTGLPMGPEGIQLIEDQFAAALYIKAGFDAGFLRYQYYLVEKPDWQ